jgi:hypothetical protein
MTIEGLSDDEELHPVQTAFLGAQALVPDGIQAGRFGDCKGASRHSFSGALPTACNPSLCYYNYKHCHFLLQQ